MSNVNIKEVEGGEVTTLGDNDGVEVDTGTQSVWIKVTNLVQEILKRVNGLTAKTSLADADNFGITDSAASHAAKKITWANVMVAVLAYVGTFTNKRITPRVVTVTTGATPSINTDNGDVFRIGTTGDLMAAAITSLTTNLTGTPTHGQRMVLEFLDNGTARAITHGASFRSGSGCALLTTTVISKLCREVLMWDSADSIWDCVGVWVEA